MLLTEGAGFRINRLDFIRDYGNIDSRRGGTRDDSESIRPELNLTQESDMPKLVIARRKNEDQYINGTRVNVAKIAGNRVTLTVFPEDKDVKIARGENVREEERNKQRGWIESQGTTRDASS